MFQPISYLDKNLIPIDCVMTMMVLEAHISQVQEAVVYLYVKLISQEDHITYINISRGLTIQEML